jgi:AraC-like DNA-binding protein
MHVSLINPYVRVAMESVIASGHNIMTRVIYDYELIYLQKGSFTFIYGGMPHQCTEGDFIFIRPGVPHSFQIENGDISQPHIHFDITYRPQSESIPVSFKNIDKMTDSERRLIHNDHFSDYPLMPIITVKNKDEFLSRFYSVISGENDVIMKKGLLTQLISDIIRDNFPDMLEESQSVSVARQIKDYIDAGNGMGMSLDDFANTFYYDKFYLERKFKKAFSLSLIEYRNKKRMELANTLLNIHSVSSVSEMLGYRSIYSFSRAYKAHFGYSPNNRHNQSE